MKIILAVILISAAVAYFFYSKKEANKAAKNNVKKLEASPPKPQYRCVMINTGLNACSAAQAMAMKPILMNEAPILPLKGCNMAKCDCKFTRHNDRRSDSRRDRLKSAEEIMGNANNRREKKERRKQRY